MPWLRSEEVSSQQQADLEAMGLSLAELPERAAAVLLHGLGLAFAEAQEVARRPLPTAAAASLGDRQASS